MGFMDFPTWNDVQPNLAWLIKAYQDLKTAYDGVKATVEKHEKKYNKIPQYVDEKVNAKVATEVEKLNTLITKIDKAEQEINKKISQIDTTLEKYKTDIAKNNKNTFDAVQGLIRDAKTYYDANFNLLRDTLTDYMDKSVKDIESKISELRTYVQSLYATYDKIIMAHIDSAIKDAVKLQPKYINPTNGQTEDLQTILNTLENLGAVKPVAFAVDKMHIAISSYDRFHIPVWVFDNYGFLWMAFYKNNYKYNMMRSPFDGCYTPVKDVVKGLYTFHLKGVRVDDFDNAMRGGKLSVTFLDSQCIDVRTFDWTYKWFSPFFGIRADVFDYWLNRFGRTVEEFDAANIPIINIDDTGRWFYWLLDGLYKPDFQPGDSPMECVPPTVLPCPCHKHEPPKPPHKPDIGCKPHHKPPHCHDNKHKCDIDGIRVFNY